MKTTTAVLAVMTLVMAGGLMPVIASESVGNKICPVGGEAVGTMGEAVDVEYNGKIYKLCCAMCVRDFNKDPEKYSKIADAEVAAGVEDGAMMDADDDAMDQMADETGDMDADMMDYDETGEETEKENMETGK